MRHFFTSCLKHAVDCHVLNRVPIPSLSELHGAVQIRASTLGFGVLVAVIGAQAVLLGKGKTIVMNPPLRAESTPAESNSTTI